MSSLSFSQGDMSDLFKIVEVRIGPNGRLERIGRVWHATIERARFAAMQLANGSLSLRVEVQRADGSVVATF